MRVLWAYKRCSRFSRHFLTFLIGPCAFIPTGQETKARADATKQLKLEQRSENLKRTLLFLSIPFNIFYNQHYSSGWFGENISAFLLACSLFSLCIYVCVCVCITSISSAILHLSLLLLSILLPPHPLLGLLRLLFTIIASVVRRFDPDAGHLCLLRAILLQRRHRCGRPLAWLVRRTSLALSLSLSLSPHLITSHTWSFAHYPHQHLSYWFVCFYV
jgi:hypothetical protein